MKSRLFFPVFAVLFIPMLFVLLLSSSATGGTPVSGIILPDDPTLEEDDLKYKVATWKGEIDVIGDVVVPPGVTLTIEAGTTVRFNVGDNVNTYVQDSFPDEDVGTTIWLLVQGSLKAEGTSEKRITFTSNATHPQKGDWSGIVFHEITGDSILKYCIVEYSGDAINTSGDPGNTNHTITIHNNHIRYSEEGILLSAAGKADIQYNTIHDTYEGVEYHKSMKGICKPVTLKNNIIFYNEIGVNNASRNCSYVTSYNDVWNNDLNYSAYSNATIDSSFDISGGVDPEFLNYPDDVRLLPTSPCLTASDNGGRIGAYDAESMWYWDNDGDGYGDASGIPVESQTFGYVIDNTDCEDNDGNIHPGATEICGDEIDQDCSGADTVCEYNAALAYDIQQLYIGYLGRPADKAGLNYWVNNVTTGVLTMEHLRTNLTNEQPEYTDIYGGLTRSQLVSKIYRNLFDREPDTDGLNYWVSGGGSTVNADQLIVAFLSAALTTDQLLLDKKTTEALYDTENF